MVLPIDSMADSMPKNSTQEPTTSPIAPPSCESAVVMMLATRETVSPSVPMLAATAPSGENETANSAAATRPSNRYRRRSINASSNDSPTTPNAWARSPIGEINAPNSLPIPPRTTPTASKALPRLDSTGSSTSPIGPTIALMPPKNSAAPLEMPSPRPAKGSRRSVDKPLDATLRASTPAPKSSILPRSMSFRTFPNRSRSLAAGPRFLKNGSKAAPLLPNKATAAAVLWAGSWMAPRRSPIRRIWSCWERPLSSSTETPRRSSAFWAVLLSSSAPASVFCSRVIELASVSIETPLRLADSSSTWMNSNETPSWSARFPSPSTRSSRSSRPLATELAPAPNAATAASPAVNGFTSAATDAPMLVSPPARPAPPPNTLLSPSPADDRPDSRPATLPIGPGRADRTPESSLNLSVPPSPLAADASSNAAADLVALSKSDVAFVSAELYVSCEMRPAARWELSSCTWASYFCCGERLACVI